MKLRLSTALRTALLTAMAATCSAAFADTADTLNLYILTGQSNSLGCIYSDNVSAEQLAYYSTAGTTDIQYWQGSSTSGGAYLNEDMKSNPHWATVAEGAYGTNNTVCLGPEYGFSYMMSKNGWGVDTNNTIAIIKVSCDGGGNYQWQANNNFYKYGVLQHIKDAINAISKSEKLSRYTHINLAGLLYLQGESNSTADMYNNAASRYDAFLAQLKSDLAADGYGPEILDKLTILPISVAGEPATWGDARTDNSNRTAIRLQNLAGSEGHENMGWVFTQDLDKSPNDTKNDVHYGEKAQITIGARYAYAMALVHNATATEDDQWTIGTVRNDHFDGCGGYTPVGAGAFTATTGMSYSLNDAGAWWNGAAPTDQDVLTWDVSSANQKNGETISADLAVKGLRVEDPYNSVILIKNLGSGDHTLSVGSAGITAQRSDLTIDTKLAVTADQDWTINRGHTLTVNGTLSGDHMVTIAGNDAEGRSTVNIARMSGTGGPSFTLGDHIDLNLASASDTVTIGSLTLGSGDVINLGGDSCISLDIGNLQAASGGTFNFNLSNTTVYDNMTLGAGSSLGGDFVFHIAVGSSIINGGTFTLVRNWAGNATYTADYMGLGAGMNTNFAVQDGNLVLTISSVADKDYSKPWIAGEQTPYIGTSGFNSVCKDAGNVKVTSTPASGNVYVFTAATNLTSTTDKYAELDSGSYAKGVGVVGTNSFGDNLVVSGDMYMKITGTATQTYANTYGVVNATLNGSAYLEMNAAGATFSNVTGVYQASVSGSVTMVFKAGTFGANDSPILGGTNNPNNKSTVGEGVYMQFEGGTFNGIVYGGSTNPGGGAGTTPTISNGTHLLATKGSNAYFSQNIYGGNNHANAIVDGGVEMILAGGTYSESVYGGNHSGGTIKGGVSLVLAGGTYSKSVYGGNNTGGSIENGVQVIATDGMNLTGGQLVVGGNNTGGSISGGVDMLVDGGSYTSIYGGNASGGSISGGIQMTISGGVFYRASNVGRISGAGNGGTVEGDVAVIIMGGDFAYWNNYTSFPNCGIYAGSVSGGATVTGNTSIVLKDIDNDNEFVSSKKYTGILSGKNHTVATAASISGTSTLVLDHYTADAVYASLRDFDTISATNGTNTTFGTTNRGGASGFSIDSTSTINFTNANANLGTLHGTGRAVVSGSGGGANTAFSLGDDWTGTVVISGTQVGSGGVEYDFDNFGHAGSTIELVGLGVGSGGKRKLVGDKTYDADLKLVGGANNIGFFLQAVETDATYTFNGDWAGSGDFEMRQDDVTWGSATFLFNGDMSGFSGKFLSNGAITLQFGNGGNGITDGSVSGTGEFNGNNSADGHMLKVVYNYAKNVAASNNFKGNLQLVKQGAGTLVITTQDNTYTGGTLIEGGRIYLQSLGCLGDSPVTVKTGGALQVNNFTLTAGATGESVITLPDVNDGRGIWTDMTALGSVTLGDGATLAVNGDMSVAELAAMGTDAHIDVTNGAKLTLNSIAGNVYGVNQLVMGNGTNTGTFAIAQGQTLKTLNNGSQYDYKGATDSATISGSHGYGISLGNYYQTFNGLEISSAAGSVDIYAKVTDSAISAAGKGVVVKGHSQHDSIYTFTDVAVGSFWVDPTVKNLTISGDIDISGKLTNQNSLVTIGGSGTANIGGLLSLWNGATFKITDGRDLGSVHLDNTNGALIIIENGSMTLSENVTVQRTKNSQADGYGNLRLGGSGTTGTVKIAEGKTLTSGGDAVSFTALSAGSSISGSGGGELSVWNQNQTFKDVRIDLTANARGINADMTGSVLNLAGTGNYTLDKDNGKGSGYNRSMQGLNIQSDEAGVTAYRDVTLTGDSVFEGGYVINTAGKSLTIEKSVTLGGNGSIQSAAENPGVVIRAKGMGRLMMAAAGVPEGETSATPPATRVTNAVITDSGIEGTGSATSSLSNAIIMLDGGGKALSGLTLDNTVISLDEGVYLSLGDVVFSANSSVEGGTVSTGTITQQVSADSIISTRVTGSGEDRVMHVTLANNILGNIGSFSDLTLELDWDFICTLAYGNLDADTGKLLLTFSGMSETTGLFNGTEGDLAAHVTATAGAPYGPITSITYGSAANQLMLTLNANIPEPATATLSLLALAGLAARRRRK